MRAADRLITHYPHARKVLQGRGSAGLESRAQIEMTALSELIYTVDCFRNSRLTVGADVTWPADTSGGAAFVITAGGVEVVNFPRTATSDAVARVDADVALDHCDGTTTDIAVQCHADGLKVRIDTLEVTFEKELPARARSALVLPETGALEGEIVRLTDRRLFDPDAPASLHPYSPWAMELIARHRDGLVLDYGAGLPSCHFRNVVTADIVDAPGVDVILDDGTLPFADDTFDAVLSLAVLEHVPNPFRYADELLRVLREGGELYVDSAFIQHYHGWPHHYFNTTQMGVREVFRGKVEELECGVRPYQNATLALNLVLGDWLAALPPSLREEAEAMSLDEFIGLLRGNPYTNRLSSALGPEADRLISAGVFFHGRKRAG